MAPKHWSQPRKTRGRGAPSNNTGRFEPRQTVNYDDGWETLADEPDRVPTLVTPERTVNAFASNDSPDVPFRLSINPYKGCEHGCVYCFARPTHAYLGLSPGLDFETKIFSKPDAPERLREALSKPRYRPSPIALGANTDPYQPAERELRITRGILEVLAEFRQPACIVTKSRNVVRDLDVLQQMAQRNLIRVFVSVTTLKNEIAQTLEPRASAPAARVATLARLSKAGVPVSVLVSPVIPALTDGEMESILEASAQAGAQSAGYILLRLPGEVKELFEQWLELHFPRKREKVLGLMRDAHGGQLYRSQFGTRMRGSGPYASMLEKRFRLAAQRLGLAPREQDLSVEHFRVPPRPGSNLELFD